MDRPKGAVSFVVKVFQLRHVAPPAGDKPNKKDVLRIQVKHNKKKTSADIDWIGTKHRWRATSLAWKVTSTEAQSVQIKLTRGDRALGYLEAPVSHFFSSTHKWFSFAEKKEAKMSTSAKNLPVQGDARASRGTHEGLPPAALIYFQAVDADKPELDPEQIRSFESRREAILKKPWRTTRKAIPKDVYEGDWNTRFQAILETIRSAQHDSKSSVTSFQMYSNLLHLVQDFIHCATAYGKIIMEEAHLPKNDKTIKPLPLGGVAGGEKYLIRNILFKFAIDEKGLFDDPANAAKIAGHDLKGLNCYVNCNIEGLCFPLMALLDYRGLRLIAISYIPVDSTTLVYGTSDASKMDRAIHTDDETLNEMMRLSARILNLKEHGCTSTSVGTKRLNSALDLEGHKGRDGRYYLLDFSRAMPPAEPVPGIRGGYLFQLLRPEFVKAYSRALSPDAYAKLFREDVKDDEEVHEATQYLFHTTIPTAAKALFVKLNKLERYTSLQALRITEAIHKEGINCRFLGLLAEQFMRMTSTPQTNAAIKAKLCRHLLLLEMVARVIKAETNRKFRELTQSLKESGTTLALEEPYRRVAIDYLNLVFGNSEESDALWNGTLKANLMKKFPGDYIPPSAGAFFKQFVVTVPALPDTTVTAGRVLLLDRLMGMLGISLFHMEEFHHPHSFDHAHPIDEFYLDTISIKVKQMNWGRIAQGSCFLYKGIKHASAQGRRMLQLARETFENALDSETNNKLLLLGYAKSLMSLAKSCLKDDPSGREQPVNPEEMNELDASTREYLERALKVDEDDAVTLYEMAQYWQDVPGQEHKVEDLYLRALERDPNYVQCLIDYAQFLQGESDGKRDYKRETAAEKFIQRASACSMKGTREHTLALSTLNPQSNEQSIELAFQVKPHETTLRIHSLLSIDDRLVWSGCENGLLYKWQRDGMATCSFQAHQKTVYALERHGNTVWSAGSDGLVRVWPLDAGQAKQAQHLREFNIMPNHKCTLLALENHVISFDTSGAVLIWNATTYALDKAVQLETPELGICCAVRVSETEAWLGLSNGEIQSFNLQTWKLGTVWRAHKRRVLAMAVHEDLVWSSSDEAIIWEIRLRRPRKEIAHMKLTALHSDGLVMWGFNSTDRTNYALTIFKAADGTQLQHVVQHRDVINALCTVGPRVWSGSADGSICAWQPPDDKRRREMGMSRHDMRLSLYKAQTPLSASPSPSMPSLPSTYASAATASLALSVSPRLSPRDALKVSSATTTSTNSAGAGAGSDSDNNDELAFPASWGVAPSTEVKRSPRLHTASARTAPAASFGNSYAQPPPLSASSSSNPLDSSTSESSGSGGGSGNSGAGGFPERTGGLAPRRRAGTQMSLADLGGAYDQDQSPFVASRAPVKLAPAREAKFVPEPDSSYREPPVLTPAMQAQPTHVRRKSPPASSGRLSSRARSGSTSGTQLRSNNLLENVTVSPRAVDDDEIERRGSRSSKRASSVDASAPVSGDASDGSPKPPRRAGLARTNG